MPVTTGTPQSAAIKSTRTGNPISSPESLLAHVHAGGWPLSLANLLDYLRGRLGPTWTWPAAGDADAWLRAVRALPPAATRPRAQPPSALPAITSPTALLAHLNAQYAQPGFLTIRDLYRALRGHLGGHWTWPTCRDRRGWAQTVEAALQLVSTESAAGRPEERIT